MVIRDFRLHQPHAVLERSSEAPTLPPSTPPQIDVTQVAASLSDALDLVGVAAIQHGKRVAWFATEIGQAIGLTPLQLDELFLGALLHDCGVSRTTDHRQLIDQFAWENAPAHCRIGHELLADFAPFRRQAEMVLLHHTHWDDPRLETRDFGLARMANAIFLADRVDALGFRRYGKDILLARADIRQVVQNLRGSFFESELVEGFLFASESEAFWLMTEPVHLARWFEDSCRRARERPAAKRELRDLARIFARIVDAKSRFTAEHSEGVAALAGWLGGRVGLDADTCEKLELAGLLHDLGKLRVPDEILDKPDRLDPAEFAAMERHSFETWQVLRRVEAFRDIAGWAAWHHEKLSGKGYPFHRRDGEIPLPARIVAVADVFQALAQDRPYRAGLEPAKVVDLLDEMVLEAHLDADLVDVVAANRDACWTLARGAASPTDSR